MLLLSIGLSCAAFWGCQRKASQAGSDHRPPNIVYFQGTKPGPPHEWLYWRKDKMAAVRHGQQKLIRLEGYGYRLYDLEKGRAETEDLHNLQPWQFKELKAGLEQWEKGLQPPHWLEGE